jgi:hypothetical protein
MANLTAYVHVRSMDSDLTDAGELAIRVQFSFICNKAFHANILEAQATISGADSGTARASLGAAIKAKIEQFTGGNTVSLVVL